MKNIIMAIVAALCLLAAGTAQAALRDNNDGTITDTANGHIWLKNANCFGKMNWNDAMAAAKSLHSGMCGLTDNSAAGQWQLCTAIYLCSRSCETGPFTNVQQDKYWSSQMSSNWSGWACYVDIPSHSGSDAPMSNTYYVWPMRYK